METTADMDIAGDCDGDAAGSEGTASEILDQAAYYQLLESLSILPDWRTMDRYSGKDEQPTGLREVRESEISTILHSGSGYRSTTDICSGGTEEIPADCRGCEDVAVCYGNEYK